MPLQYAVQQFAEQRLSAFHKLRIDARYVDLAQIEVRSRVIAEPGEHIEDAGPVLRMVEHHQRPTRKPLRKCRKFSGRNLSQLSKLPPFPPLAYKPQRVRFGRNRHTF